MQKQLQGREGDLDGLLGVVVGCGEFWALLVGLCGEDTNVAMSGPSARVAAGGRGWGKQQLFISCYQSME